MISDVPIKVIYDGDGARRVFPFPECRVDMSEEIKVWFRDHNGVRQLEENYSVDIVNRTVTYPVQTGGSTLAAGEQLLVMRIVPYTQDLDSSVNPFLASNVEAEMDDLEMQIQQLKEEVGRSLKGTVFEEDLGIVDVERAIAASDRAVAAADHAEQMRDETQEIKDSALEEITELRDSALEEVTELRDSALEDLGDKAQEGYDLIGSRIAEGLVKITDKTQEGYESLTGIILDGERSLQTKIDGGLSALGSKEAEGLENIQDKVATWEGTLAGLVDSGVDQISSMSEESLVEMVDLRDATAEAKRQACKCADNSKLSSESAQNSEDEAARQARLAAQSAEQAGASASMAHSSEAVPWDPTTDYNYPDVVAGPDGHTWRAIDGSDHTGPTVGIAPAEDQHHWVRISFTEAEYFELAPDGESLMPTWGTGYSSLWTTDTLNNLMPA